jgi:hypothetical protein
VALIFGFVLAILAGLLVLEPLLRSGRGGPAPSPLFSDSDDEDDPALARRDQALAALKEIDFDRATGKLSDEDYAEMKTRFTAEALEALRVVDAAADMSSPDHVEAMIAAARAPRAPSPASRFCLECGAPSQAGTRFCLECGTAAEALAP